jgi:hypothetical protein
VSAVLHWTHPYPSRMSTTSTASFHAWWDLASGLSAREQARAVAVYGVQGLSTGVNSMTRSSTSAPLRSLAGSHVGSCTTRATVAGTTSTTAV